MLILLCKIISYISYKLNLGNGSTWPGHIALNLNPKILTKLEAKLTFGSIVIAGTNGKTTTSKLIKEVLEKKYKVVQNTSGANLLNGITSSLINNSSSDIGVFEVDENTLPLLIDSFTPKIIVLLNLFRDQLDRYGEVNTIALKWKKALEKLPSSTTVVLNADDPQIAFLGQNLKANVVYFGLDDPKLFLQTPEHATDSTYCPKCGEKLIYTGIYYSHIGLYRCGQCLFKRPDAVNLEIKPIMSGTYNLYNLLAAQVVLNEVGFKNSEINFGNFQPAFGRQEKIIINNKKIIIVLSKNPTGFNQSIRTLDEFSKEKKTIMLVLNDRIPDGRDISWIWDVDFENLKPSKVFISGDRSYDMGLRIKYAGFKNYEIYDDLKTCITKALSETDNLYILPTYSAMLEVRKILSGKKIL